MKTKTIVNVVIIVAVAGGVIWGLTYLKNQQDKAKKTTAAAPAPTATT